MATTPGQRFVRRHDAARTTTVNTTAADISYDTAVLSEGGYSWSSPEVTVDEAGKYLCIYDIGEVQLASTRAVGTLVPSVNTVDQTYYKARSRYLRNSGGNHGVSFGCCILDLAVSDDVKIRNPATVTGTDGFGSYATNVNQGGGFQMVYLGDGNFTEVQRTATETTTLSLVNATRPWIDSTGTWTQLTFNSEVVDDAGLYGGSGGDITLEADKKYLIVYGATITGSSNQRFTGHLQLDIDGVNVQHSTGYERNNASDGPPMQGMYLHEVGGTAETLQLYTTVEQEDVAVSNTVVVENAYLQIYELPDGAEWIHVDNSTTDSLDTAFAGTTTYYDTPLSATFRADGDSDLSLDGANDAVQNDSGASLSLLAIGWHMTDRDAGTSGTRKHCWSYWDNGGTRLAYGISGGYNRGQQGNDDTHRLAYIGAALLDLANAADLSFVVRDPVSAVNSDMGVYASTNRHYLGVQVLKLDTLVVAGDVDRAPDEGTLDLTGKVPIANVTHSADPLLGELDLVGQAPTLFREYNTAVPEGTLTLSGDAPSAELTHSGSPAVATLALTGQAPTVQLTHSGAPAAGAMALTGQVPAISVTVSAAPLVGALVLAGEAPTAELTLSASPAVETLTLTGQAPTPQLTLSADPAVTALTLEGQAPTVQLTLSASPAQGALTLEGQAPASLAGDSRALDVPYGFLRVFSIRGLQFCGITPTIEVTTDDAVEIPVGAGTLSLSGEAPTLEVDLPYEVGQGTLSLTGQASTLDLAISVAGGVLTLAGASPNVASGLFPTVPAGSAVLAGQAPSLGRTYSPAPPAGALLLTTHSTSSGASHSRYMPETALGMAGHISFLHPHVVRAPAAVALTLAGFGSIIPINNNKVTPGYDQLLFSGQVPYIITPVEVAPGALSFTGKQGSLIGPEVPSGTLSLIMETPVLSQTVTQYDEANTRVISLTAKHSLRII